MGGNAAREIATARPFLIRGERPPDVAAPPVAAAAQTLLGIWSRIVCDRDAFTLPVGQRSHIEARFTSALLTSANEPSDIRFSGEYHALGAPQVSGDRITVTGSITGMAVTRVAGAASPNVSYPTVPVTIVKSVPASGDVSLAITFGPPEKDHVEFVATWTGTDKIVATLKSFDVAPERETRTVVLFRVELMTNADVFQTTNPLHVAIEQGLKVLETKLKTEPDFAEDAVKSLVPPATASEETLVRAVRDWVLFHRRRDKACQFVKEVVAAPTRTYVGYEVTLPNESADTLAVFQKELETGVFSKNHVPRRFESVVFGAGIADIIDPGQKKLSDDWSALPPGNVIVSAAVFNSSPAIADGDSLALARLHRLESALAPTSKPRPTAEHRLFQSLPESLGGGHPDGAMVFATVRAVSCVSAFRVVFGKLEEVTKQTTIGKLATVLGKQAFALGEAEFLDSGTAPTDATMDKIEGNWGVPFPPGKGFVVIREDVTGDAVARFESRGKTVWTEMEGKGDFGATSKGKFNNGIDCPAIVLLEEQRVEPVVGPPRTARFVIYKEKSQEGPHLGPNALKPIVDFIAPHTWLEKLPKALLDLSVLNKNKPFVMEFAPDEPQDDDAEERMNAVFKVMKEANLITPNTTPTLVRLQSPDDQKLLDMSGQDVKVNDIVFLRRG